MPARSVRNRRAVWRRGARMTRDFKQAVQARIARDPAYRKELLREGVACLLSGDLDTGKALLRDYINATIGFEKLSVMTDTPVEEPHAHARSKGKPSGPQLVRDNWAPAAGRRASVRIVVEVLTANGGVECKLPIRQWATCSRPVGKRRRGDVNDVPSAACLAAQGSIGAFLQRQLPRSV